MAQTILIKAAISLAERQFAQLVEQDLTQKTVRQNMIKTLQMEFRQQAEDLRVANDRAIRAEDAEVAMSALFGKQGEELLAAKAIIARLQWDAASAVARCAETELDLAEEKARSRGLRMQLETAQDGKEDVKRNLDDEVSRHRTDLLINSSLWREHGHLTSVNDALHHRVEKLEAELVLAEQTAAPALPREATPPANNLRSTTSAIHTINEESGRLTAVEAALATLQAVYVANTVEKEALEDKVGALAAELAMTLEVRKEQQEQVSALEKRVSDLECKLETPVKALLGSPLSDTATLCTSPEPSTTVANSPEPSLSSSPVAGLAIMVPAPESPATVISANQVSMESRATPPVPANTPSKPSGQAAAASRDRIIPASGPKTAGPAATDQSDRPLNRKERIATCPRKPAEHDSKTTAEGFTSSAVPTRRVTRRTTPTPQPVAGPSRPQLSFPPASAQVDKAPKDVLRNTSRPRAGETNQVTTAGSSRTPSLATIAAAIALPPASARDNEESGAVRRSLERPPRRPLQDWNGEGPARRGELENVKTTSGTFYLDGAPRHLPSSPPEDRLVRISSTLQTAAPTSANEAGKSCRKQVDAPKCTPKKRGPTENTRRLLREAEYMLRGPQIPTPKRLPPLGKTPPRKRSVHRPIIPGYPSTVRGPRTLFRAPLATVDIDSGDNLWNYNHMAESSHYSQIYIGAEEEDDDSFDVSAPGIHILSGLNDSPFKTSTPKRKATNESNLPHLTQFNGLAKRIGIKYSPKKTNNHRQAAVFAPLKAGMGIVPEPEEFDVSRYPLPDMDADMDDVPEKKWKGKEKEIYPINTPTPIRTVRFAESSKVGSTRGNPANADMSAGPSTKTFPDVILVEYASQPQGANVSRSSGGLIPGRTEQLSLPIEINDGSDEEQSSYRTEILIDEVSFACDESSMDDEESYQILDRWFCNPQIPEMLDHAMNDRSIFDLSAIMPNDATNTTEYQIVQAEVDDTTGGVDVTLTIPIADVSCVLRELAPSDMRGWNGLQYEDGSFVMVLPDQSMTVDQVPPSDDSFDSGRKAVA